MENSNEALQEETHEEPVTTDAMGKIHNAVLNKATMLLASALVMFLEIVFFHVLVYISNYINATAVISAALLGIALSGLWAYRLRRTRNSAALSWIASLCGVAVVLCIVNCVAFPVLLAFPIVLMLPFMCVSTLIAYLFGEMKAHTAYFWNLFGAAVGVLAACILIPLVRSENALLFAITLCGILGMMLALSTAKGRVFNVICAGVVIVAGLGSFSMNLANNYFDFGTITRASADDKFKLYSYMRRWKDAEILYSRDNLVARVDIVKLATSKNLQTFQEAVMSDHVLSYAPRQYSWDVRVPNALVTPNPKILCIGTSAEGVTKTCKYLSHGDMVGIEINPAIVDLMENELFEPSARAYEDLDIQVTDARTYLEGTDEKFDIMTLMNTHTRGRVDQNAGMPQYLFTEEAFALMFEHLTDRGALAIEEVRAGDAADFFTRKIFASAIAGLKRLGYTSNFEQHFYAYTYRVGTWKYIIFLIRKNPFDEESIARMDEWFKIKKEKYTISVKELTHVIHPARRIDSVWAQFVRNPEGETQRILEEEQLDVAATTDNRPFLFDLDVRFAAEWRIFMLSAVATLLLILVPCFIIFRRAFTQGAVKGSVTILYFSLIGAAYMLIEIALIQKYQLFLGSPIYAVVLVLTAILLFSGLGGLATGILPEWLRKGAFLLIPILTLILVFVLPNLFAATQSSPFVGKVLLALATLFPLFFCMGVPMPKGLSVVHQTANADSVPLLYGVNGAFGTIGTTLSLLISVHSGFAITLYLGMVLYLVAFVTLLLMQRLRAA